MANAGEDAIICAGSESFQITGASASDYSSLNWTSSGMGTLLNPTTINPTYIPQIGETGNIYFTLIATGISPCTSTSDQMLLTIIPAAVATAGNDDSICEGQSFVPNTSYAGYYNSLLWTTSGTGTFSNPTIQFPTYLPSQEDITDGGVVLTLTAFGSAPCGNQSDSMNLSIFATVAAHAGPDAATCKGVPYTVTGASAQNYSSILWMHNGSGNLTGAATIVPTYEPAPNESGIVTLTLTATGSAFCGNSIDAMELTINEPPSIGAGPDAVSCELSPVILGNAIVSGAESILWTTSGTGSFDNPELLHTTYTPSANDVTNGSVVLTLTADALASCNDLSDDLTVYFTRSASGFAGNDTIICSNVAYTVTGATAVNYSVIHWSHNGSGILSGENTLYPTYTPAVGESGIVILIMNITGYEPCGNVTDSISIEVRPAAIANAGADQLSCETSPISISQATASNYNSITWSSTGSGSFNDISALNPVYSPSLADVDAGSVVLSIFVTGNAPCSNGSDQVILTFEKKPYANAGPGISSCSGIPVTVTSGTASNYSSLLWIHNGTGILGNANTLNPTYTPGAGETGVVTLTLTVTGNQVCGSIVVTSTTSLTILPSLIVSAGPDQTIPAGSSTILNGTISGASGSYIISWDPANLSLNPASLNDTTLLLNSSTLFTLSVMDLNSGCTTSDSVLISMGMANLPPIANPDYDTASVDQPAVISILSNDSDPDGFITGITITRNPGHGSILLNQDNTITYTPEEGFEGADTLIYQICDNGVPNKCDTALVIIRVFGLRPFDDITIYNFLTPNGDSHNDVWTIENIEYWPENEVLIFNRWGDKIREFQHYNNTSIVWDGKNFKDKAVPDGTYFYIVKVRHLEAQTSVMKEESQTGFIMVKSNRKQ